MDHHTPERKDPEQDGQLPDRYDNDQPTTEAEHNEYQARLERSWKHAAWRTEMARRLRASGHTPSLPDSAF